MFKLHDVRESVMWKESHKEGIEDRNVDLIRSWREKGKSFKEIAELLELTVAEVRRLARRPS